LQQILIIFQSPPKRLNDPPNVRQLSVGHAGYARILTGLRGQEFQVLEISYDLILSHKYQSREFSQMFVQSIRKLRSKRISCNKFKSW